MRVTRNTCSICHFPMPKHRLSETNRSRLLHSIDLMAHTSFSRGQQFDAFKQLLTSLPPFDVVVDGANVGFANANFDLKHGGELKLNTRNIESMVDALDARNLHPLVILHRYHLRHMKEPQSLATMETLQKRQQLVFVKEGSNDDWYWLHAALTSPSRMFVTNDRMRDHLFHAEEEETSFRVFREERQIRYTISPVNNRVSFHFPLGYSICVQETKNGFHLPLGHMEKTEFRIQQWYCFRNKSATIAQLMKRIRWVCLFITSLTDCDKSGFRHKRQNKQQRKSLPLSLKTNLRKVKRTRFLLPR
ncbi:hypothetical protein WA538_002002 [Blastocystis sp. DL]